jgi:hypothetical protein
VAMIGDLFDRTGLVMWPDFLARYGDGPVVVAERSKDILADDVPAGRELDDSHVSAGSQVVAPAEAAGRDVRGGPDPGSRGAAQPSPEQTPLPSKRPSPAAADDLLEIPLILVRPLQGDWGRALFKKGLAYLTKVYDEPPEELRPLLGDWIAQSGNDHRKVFHLLAQAQTKKEPDPKTWVSNVLSECEGVQSPA